MRLGAWQKAAMVVNHVQATVVGGAVHALLAKGPRTA